MSNKKRSKRKRAVSIKSELDPISKIIKLVWKNRFKLIKYFLTVLVGVLFAIEYFALRVWGVKNELAIQMVSLNGLNYLPVMPCFIFVIVFTGIMEILKRVFKSRKVLISLCVAHSLIYTAIISIIFQFNLFIFIMLCLSGLIYCPIFLKFIRPLYLKDSRKLAENALNYENKKYKVPVILTELICMFMNFVVIVLMIGLVYSFIPTRHLIDKNSSQIVVCSVDNKALVSKFRLEYSKSGFKYIILDKDSISVENLSTGSFTLQQEKLIFSEKKID